MARRRTNDPGALFLHPHKKKLSVVAKCTPATSQLLGILCEENPGATIREIREMVNYDSDAIEVCDKHIEIGLGDEVPRWTYA